MCPSMHVPLSPQRHPSVEDSILVISQLLAWRPVLGVTQCQLTAPAALRAQLPVAFRVWAATPKCVLTHNARGVYISHTGHDCPLVYRQVMNCSVLWRKSKKATDTCSDPGKKDFISKCCYKIVQVKGVGRWGCHSPTPFWGECISF